MLSLLQHFQAFIAARDFCEVLVNLQSERLVFELCKLLKFTRTPLDDMCDVNVLRARCHIIPVSLFLCSFLWASV